VKRNPGPSKTEQQSPLRPSLSPPDSALLHLHFIRAPLLVTQDKPQRRVGQVRHLPFDRELQLLHRHSSCNSLGKVNTT
jgi:hypothetical protein